MSIGIRLHDAAPGTLAQRAQAVRAQGFTHVQLALGKTLGAPYATPAACTGGLATLVTQTLSPLSVSVLGCYLHLTHPDEAVYRQALSHYEAHLRLSRWLGGCVVGTETGNPTPDNHYDAALSHSDEALAFFIRRLRPIVASAEKLGAILAIEPVYTHVVSTPRRARRVLSEIDSPNLRIILDPVNLLHPDNLDRREAVLAEAMGLLGEAAVVVHLKDYVLNGDSLRPVAAGQGEMDFSPLLAYLAREKPHVPILLENTVPANAEATRQRIADALARHARLAGLAEGYDDPLPSPGCHNSGAKQADG